MEEEDAEAELERELAALRSNSEVSITAYLETSPGLGQNLTTSDDDSSSDEEPASFHAFRTALARRDAFCERLQQELHDGSCAPATLEGDTSVAVDSPEQGEDGGSPSTHDPVSSMHLLLGGKDIGSVVATLQSRVVAQRLQPSEPSPAAADHVLGAPANQLADVPVRTIILAADRAAELAREDQRASAQQEQERLHKQGAEVLMQREAEERALHASRLAALQAAQQAIMARAEQEAAAAAAEAAAFARQQEQLSQRLAQQASDLARRRQAAAAAQQELDEQLAAQAWRGFAARHIQRAWRKYAASPAAMLRKHRVTLIQAAWRGRAARKAVGGMRQQQAVLLQLEAAVAKGDMGAVQQVAEQASNMGCGAQVAAQVTAFHAAAHQAAERLATAAATGTALLMSTAVQAAQRFPHLAPAIADASSVFSARRQQAEGALAAAVAGRPVREVVQLAEQAALLGCDPAHLASSLDAARKRDAALAATLLAAAGASPHDPAGFGELVSQAQRLGLEGDVATARLLLDRRRRALLVRLAGLQAKAHGAAGVRPSAVELQALSLEAVALGMEREAEQLSAQLRAQQDALQARLTAAAANSSPAALQALLEEAAEAGLGQEVLAGAQAAMAQRVQAAGQAVQEAASSGTILEYRRARWEALVCGALEPVDRAQHLLQQRRRTVSQQLAAAFSHLASLLQPGGAAATTSQDTAGAAGIPGIPGMPSSLVPGVKGSSSAAGGAALPHHSQLARQLAMAMAEAAGLAPLLPSTTTSTPRLHDPANPSLPHTPSMGHTSSSPSALPRPVMQPRGSRSLQLKVLCSLAAGSALPPAVAACLAPPARLASGPAPTAPHGPYPPAGSRLLGTGRQQQLGQGAKDVQQQREQAQGREQQQAVEQAWQALVAALRLGLLSGAKLALGALHLQGQVQAAQGVQTVASIRVSSDYWGNLQLNSWQQQGQQGQQEQQGQQQAQDDPMGGDPIACAALKQLHAPPGQDTTGEQGQVELTSSWLWPVQQECQASFQLAASRRKQQPPPGPAPATPPPHPSPRPLLPPTAPYRQQHLPAGLTKPLTQQLLLSITAHSHSQPPQPTPLIHPGPLRHPPSTFTTSTMRPTGTTVSSPAQPPRPHPAAAPAHPPAPAGVPPAPCSPLLAVTQLDLGLERLGSLAGLSLWCPALTSLSAASNQLSSVAGLAGLARLAHLDLKGNRLDCLDGLGPLPSLRRLVLDANSLADWQPAGLGGLPALQHLSVRGNQLTSFQCSAVVRGAADAATAQAAAPATAKPSKAQQDVQNTRADKGVSSSSSSSRRGVQADMAPPPALPLLPCANTLTELHAAGNQISSLAGLAPCTALTHLDISHNLVPHLAGLASCVLLRHLNAANNCLTAWPAAELAPMLHLRHLNLNANAITSLLPPAADTHPQHRDNSTQPPPPHYPAAAAAAAAGGSHPFASPSRPGCFRPPHSAPACSGPCLPLPSQLPILLLPPSLAELLLQDNRLSRLPLLQAAPRLSSLDLSFNSLEEPSCLAALAPLTALTSLALNDTPLASHPDYTQAVQAAAPGLQEWDGNPVPAQQRAAALARAVCSNPLLALWTRQALCSSRGGCDLSHAVVAAAGSRMQPAALHPDPMAPAAAAAAAPVGGVPDGPGMAAAGLGTAPLDVWGVPAAPPLPAVIHDPGGAAPPPAAATPRPPPNTGVPLGPPWLEPLLLLAASATWSMAGSGSAGGTLPLASRQQGEPQQWLAGTWCAQLKAAEGEEAAGERLADPQQALHMVGHMAPQLPPGFEPRVLARLAGGMSHHTATGPPAAGGAGWQPGRAGMGAALCPLMTAAVGGVGDRAGVMQGGQGSGAAPCVAAQLAVYVDRPHLLPFKRLALALAGCRLHEQSAPYGDATAAAAWPAQPGCLSHSSGEAPYVVWQEYGQRHSQAMQQLRQQHCKSAQHLITWEAGQGQQREQGQQGWQEGQAGRVGQEREGQVGPGGQGAGQDQLLSSQLPWGHLSEDSLPGGVEQLVLSDAFALHQQRWLDTAATTIQARWRGYAARCKAQGVRQAQLAALRAAAAIKVQAAWRGHRVRSSEAIQSALRQRQAAADASARLQQEAMTAQAQHRARAATLIQAVFRGHLVRRRLRAAKQAARYVDEDEDEYGGVSEDFLADIENLMADQHLAIPAPPLPASHTTAARASSKPTPHPAPSIAPQQQTAPTAVSPPPSHSPPAAIMLQLPALSRAFAAAAANRRLPALPATTTAATGGGLALLPPSGTQPGHHAASPPHPSTSTTAAAGNSSSSGGGGGGGVGGGWLAPSPPAATSLSGLLLPPLSHPGSYSQDLASHRVQHTAWQQELRPPPVSVGHGHGLGPAAPQPHLGWSGGCGGEEGGEGEEGGTEEPGSPSGASHVPSSISPSAQAEVQAARQQRHREKMEALMAEWGFSDMATAEVYWRRQQRQTQGSQRRKLEARFRDPGTRLKKLQAKVEQRPKLRAEDMQRPAHHGPEVHLSKGSLRGPPSRQQPTSPGAGAGGGGGGGGKDSAPHSTATSPGGPAGALGPPAAQPRPWNSGPVSQPPAAAAQPGQQGPRSALSADAVAALSAAHGQLVPGAAVVRAWGHEAVAGVAYPLASHAPKPVVSPPPLLRSSSFGSSLGVGLAAGAPTQTVRSSQQQQVGREGGAGLLPELLPTLRRSTALSDSLPPYSSAAARTLAPHSLASAGAAAAHPPPVHLPPTGSGSGQTQARPGASTQGWSAAGPPAAAGAGAGGGAAGLLRAPRSADSLASEPLPTSSSLLGTGWQGGGPPLAAAAAPPAARVLKLGGSAGRAEPRASGGAAASAGVRSDASSGPQAVGQPLVLPQVRPVANNWVLSGVRDSSAAHQWLGGQQQGGAGRAGLMELAGVAGAQQMGLSAVPVGRAQKPGGEGAAAQKLSHKSR